MEYIVVLLLVALLGSAIGLNRIARHDYDLSTTKFKALVALIIAVCVISSTGIIALSTFNLLAYRN